MVKGFLKGTGDRVRPYGARDRSQGWSEAEPLVALGTISVPPRRGGGIRTGRVEHRMDLVRSAPLGRGSHGAPVTRDCATLHPWLQSLAPSGASWSLALVAPPGQAECSSPPLNVRVVPVMGMSTDLTN